ncbi:type II toxin-antitoxin system HipA family toxin [Pseudomaricurvus alkylphenolicus]|uniref:HipA N-terminal domain-containing protein n=1 Tax=Pseudomaricurvus alkylphenolicus TaxID=1306991 RepID=UPI0014202EA0|nr:type II toxin-antitoxin system HipA family toxin [Pseudomaricurvus alkylphenolicus]
MDQAIAAKVYLYNELCGILNRDRRGTYRFRYEANHPEHLPLSHSLPVVPEVMTWDELPPYFGNLLPEGWLLETTRRDLKLDDPLALLIALGKDLPGAVTLEKADHDGV